MPEEDAFCVFVRLMYDYKLRDLFKPSMADLSLCFYQLERLVEVCMYVRSWQQYTRIKVKCHGFESRLQQLNFFTTARVGLCCVHALYFKETQTCACVGFFQGEQTNGLRNRGGHMLELKYMDYYFAASFTNFLIFQSENWLKLRGCKTIFRGDEMPP